MAGRPLALLFLVSSSLPVAVGPFESFVLGFRPSSFPVAKGCIRRWSRSVEVLPFLVPLLVVTSSIEILSTAPNVAIEGRQSYVDRVVMSTFFSLVLLIAPFKKAA